jgi:hypothetical protein
MAYVNPWVGVPEGYPFDQLGAVRPEQRNIMHEGEYVLSPVEFDPFGTLTGLSLEKKRGSPQRDSNPCYLREREVS